MSARAASAETISAYDLRTLAAQLARRSRAKAEPLTPTAPRPRRAKPDAVVAWDRKLRERLGESLSRALDARTGEEKWRMDREERTSWSTPLILAHDGRRQVVTSATARIRSYDAASGALLWQTGGMTGNVVPSPVAVGGVYSSPVGAAGRVYVTGRKGSTLVIRKSPVFEVLARNKLDDSFTASAAPVGRDLYLRGYRSLYCIAEGASE